MNIICIHINQATSYSLLCSQYWERVSITLFKYKISDICTMHNITRQELITILSTSPITLCGIHCSQCKQPYPMYLRNHYKKTYNNQKNKRFIICQTCQSNNIQNYAKLLHELHEKALPQLNYSPYELALQVYAGLQYLQQTCSQFKKNTLRLGNISNRPNIHNRIIKGLYNSHLIFPATTKDFQLVKQHSDDLSKVIANINWQIIPNKETLQSFMNTIQSQFIDRSRSDYKFIHETLCYEIVFYECLQYLHYRLSQYKRTFSYAEGTRLVIQKGLVFFSVSQMYYLIHRATKHSINLDTLSKKHAGNLSISILEELIDKHAHNPQQVTKYNRIASYPQSHLNNILFDKVFQKADCGFYEPLHQLLQ